MKVILKHSGQWLHFCRPLKVLLAETLEDVQPLLLEAEKSGLYAAGFVSYEAAPAFDSALKAHPEPGFPLLCLGLFHAPDVMEDIERSHADSFEIGSLEPSVSRDEFVAAIGSIKEQLAEGATYQVNYTYRLYADFNGDAWAFFHDLVNGQRAEHAAFIETDDFAICSASPELFFSFNNGRLLSRPMKGTERRGRTLSEDQAQADALYQSKKNRAENIMIVDMIRNDIGRVADPGTVEVVSQFDVEKYPTVWQLTSTVAGTSSAGVTAIWNALFPCASITGAPKAKTMEIIQSLETTPRKIYTGSMGFITPEGEACFNVAIRTALIDRRVDRLEFGVGGGIIWDSEAEAEFEETLTKARVLTQPRPLYHLLETMLWEPGSGIYLLDEHMQRLGDSAEYFDIPLDVDSVIQTLEEATMLLEKAPHRVRLLVSREGHQEVQTFPLSLKQLKVKKLALAKQPVNSQDVFLFHKTTHREVYEKAKADFPAHDDVILWNDKGEVTETCIANIVIRKGQDLITPPVECGLLAGTFRTRLLKDGEINEDRISLNDLKTADEIFMINSVRKWQRAILG